MNIYIKHILLLTKRIILLLIVFQLSRAIFLIFNYNSFQENNFFSFLKAFTFGTVYDISAVLLFNLIFIIFSVLPFNFISNKHYKLILKYLFFITNAILLLANFTDIEYYKFTNKRTTFDVFSLMFLGDDMKMLLPQFIKDFWYIILLWITFVYAIIRFYPEKQLNFTKKLNLKTGVLRLFLMIFVISITAFLIRGFGLRPLAINGFTKYNNVQNIPLIINTPFSIIRTINHKGLKEKNYFNNDELKQYINPIKIFKSDSSFNKKNVVIIILESFGCNYTGFYNNKPYTPFLDSLITVSLHTTQSYANGKTSMQAMPAIISSIPNLSDQPFITSLYSGNKISGLPKVLKKEGYYSAFFHGGKNGTMGFDNFAYLAGFDDYYGRNEYNNDKDYDGNWGIYDEPYLQYVVKKMSNFKQPFITSVFTLSSHHPFNIPDKYKNKFKDGELPIYKTIEYADYALRKFFKSAKQTKWYKNTIFVLTADHTSMANTSYYWNKLGQFRIPIFFYTPDTSLIENTGNIIQQIDIMPTILDYLHYKKPFFSLGNSILQNNKSFAVNYISGIYQLIQNNYIYQFNGNEGVGLYNIKTDSLLTNNLITKEPKQVKIMENKLKAIIQTYNYSLINNKMTTE